MRKLTLSTFLTAATTSQAAALSWSTRQYLLRASALSLLIQDKDLKNTGPLLNALHDVTRFRGVRDGDGVGDGGDIISASFLAKSSTVIAREMLSVAGAQGFDAFPFSSTSLALTACVKTTSVLQLLAAAATGVTGANGSVLSLSSLNMSTLLDGATADASAAVRAKIGASPHLQISIRLLKDDKDKSVSLVCVPTWIRFALVEILKNAAVANLDHNGGASGADDGPDVCLSLELVGGGIYFAVRDFGGGFASDNTNKEIGALNSRCSGQFGWGDSANAKRSMGEAAEPNYGYSRDFGSPLEGLGMGLARVGVVAALHGGTFQVRSLTEEEGVGSVASMWIPLSGTRVMDPPVELLDYLGGRLS